MSAILYGVPGKLKTLIDRLTSARAAKIDNLDAAVTTRAPASTALSNGVWTDGRAAKLDDVLLDSDPLVAAPIALVPSDPAASSNVVAFNMGQISGLSSGSTTSTSFVDIVNYTGSGVIEFCALSILSDLCYMQLILDGVTLADVSLDPTSGNWAAKAVVGLYLNNSSVTAIALSQIPFKTSLRIRARVSSTGTAYVNFKYRTTS